MVVRRLWLQVVMAPTAGVLQRVGWDCPDPLGFGRACGGLVSPCRTSGRLRGAVGAIPPVGCVAVPPSPVSPRPPLRPRVGGISETVELVRYPWWHRLVGGMLGGALSIVCVGVGFGAGEIPGGSSATGVVAPLGVAEPS